MCEGLEEAKLQEENYETAARRRARQAESAICSAKKSRGMLTQAKSTQATLNTRLERLRSKRKLEKQTERRRGVMGVLCQARIRLDIVLSFRKLKLQGTPVYLTNIHEVYFV